MKENMKLTSSAIFSQRLLLALVRKGVSRDSAYPVIQRLSHEAISMKKDFKELLKADPFVAQSLSRDEIESCFDPGYFTRNIKAVYKRLGI